MSPTRSAYKIPEKMYRRFPEQSKQLLERIVQFIGPKTGETIVDVGTGAGFLAFELAEKVGERGKVIGLDVSNSAIQQARPRLQQRNSPEYSNSGSATFIAFRLKMSLPTSCVASP